MELIAPSGSGLQSRRKFAYVLALILPVVGTVITVHLNVLTGVPIFMNILAVVIVAILGGLGPSLLAVLVAIATRSSFLLAGLEPLFSLYYEFLHASLLFASAFVVWFMNRQRERSERRLEATLSELRERTDDLISSLNSSKAACWTIDLDSGRSERWYGGSYQLFGRPYSELEDLQSLLPLVHPDDRSKMHDVMESMKTSWEPVVFEYRVVWPNKEVHTLEMRGNRVSGRHCVWRGTTLDITERKQAEAALLNAEKLAAMGRLASTVAHEINNPLESITNLLYLANSSKSLDKETRSYLATAERELARLSNITRLTLGFVRTTANPAETGVAPIVDEVISIFHHRFETKNVHIETHYEPDVRIMIPPHELRQIVTNLISNAADAVNTDNAQILIRIFREQDKAVLTVEDNGSGIDPAYLPRIFEAFFSTKGELGTGIGLWVTKDLVEKNGGRIFAFSRSGNLSPGMVTQFRVEFPLIREPLTAQ